MLQELEVVSKFSMLAALRYGWLMEVSGAVHGGWQWDGKVTNDGYRSQGDVVSSSFQL